MADVFISYARPDIGHAERVAGIIEQLGWSVFWDRELTTGERFASRLSDELGSARAIVVLWSMASASSDWVNDEAGEGKARGNLVPVRIDETDIPLGFRQLQTVMLAPRNGLYDTQAMLSVARRIGQLVGEQDYQDRIAEIEASVYSIHDVEILKSHRILFDRPAFSVSCVDELFLLELLRAIDDVTLALNTGMVRSRTSDQLMQGPLAASYVRQEFKNAARLWKAKLQELKRLVVDFDGAFEMERLGGKSLYSKLVSFAKTNSPGVVRDFVGAMDAIDTKRNELVEEVNLLLVQYGIQKLWPIDLSSDVVRSRRMLGLDQVYACLTSHGS